MHSGCLSSRQRVPPLRYSALRPAATIKVEAVKCCWEMIVRCCRLHRVQLCSSCHGRWVCGMALSCKGSAGAPCLHVQLSSHSGIAWSMEACHALGCLGSARRERRMTDESAVTQTAWQLRVTSRDNGHILGLVYIAASFMWQRGFCYLLG